MTQPDFGNAAREATSEGLCELWYRRGGGRGPERCRAPAFLITDKAISAIEAYLCEDHMLFQAMIVEAYALDGAYD